MSVELRPTGLELFLACLKLAGLSAREVIDGNNEVLFRLKSTVSQLIESFGVHSRDLENGFTLIAQQIDSCQMLGWLSRAFEPQLVPDTPSLVSIRAQTPPPRPLWRYCSIEMEQLARTCNLLHASCHLSICKIPHITSDENQIQPDDLHFHRSFRT
jgi:hypothetical protein